jgi:hypothetical protein
MYLSLCILYLQYKLIDCIENDYFENPHKIEPEIVKMNPKIKIM